MSKVESTYSNNIVMFKALEIRGPFTDSDSCKINLNFIKKKKKGTKYRECLL